MNRILYLALVLGAVGCSSTEPAANVQIIGTLGNQPGQFSRPRAVAYTAEGDFFVVDRTGRFQRFSNDGTHEAVFRLPEFENGTPTGISLDPTDDSLWIADTHYQRILQYDTEGNLLFEFGEDGTGPGQMIFPTDVCPDPDGQSLWISEYGLRSRVMQFTRTGEFVKEWGSDEYEYTDLQRPMAIEVDSEGRLYIADAGNHRILVYSREGKRLGILSEPGAAPGQLRFPYDLALDTEENLYVVEFGNNRVSCFSTKGNPGEPGFGQLLGTWGTSGYQAGQISNAWGVAIGPMGEVLIADTYNSRVVILPEGLKQFVRKEARAASSL
ncbi:MAG: hypothetical protein SFY68_07560 [Candidatus Sumerlaeia bacterium]|nr:hypothetical protein [Candidatus Sumerlaeia bacterium]